MTHLDNVNLNYGITSELEVIQRKFKEYQTSDDLNNLQILYEALIGVSRNLPAINQERETILDQYRGFDR